MSKVLGLTGGIASGKSTVAALFKKKGAAVIDADLIAHQLVEPQQPGLAAIIATFGQDYLLADGHLNRQKLGQLVFNDPQALFKLDELTHPLIRQEILRQTATYRASGQCLIVYDIPLLFETGYQPLCDAVLVVDVQPAVQLARVEYRDHLDEKAAQARIAAQMDREERLARADFVLDTSKTTAELPFTFTKLWQSAAFQNFLNQ
ncbi:dephospho-CoA kinase [Lapidilactobacillus bayanensis]|uniref:dephospho-CoA kinase n=1 Tax=Lapidilactobacillus bayanensis TaxID=2485998 RepID=UPI000F7AAA0F|nr:dephospho-CoA kinase [Lapidilactobacillus bayanensis]